MRLSKEENLEEKFFVEADLRWDAKVFQCPVICITGH